MHAEVLRYFRWNTRYSFGKKIHVLAKHKHCKLTFPNKRKWDQFIILYLWYEMQVDLVRIPIIMSGGTLTTRMINSIALADINLSNYCCAMCYW